MTYIVNIKNQYQKSISKININIKNQYQKSIFTTSILLRLFALLESQIHTNLKTL